MCIYIYINVPLRYVKQNKQHNIRYPIRPMQLDHTAISHSQPFSARKHLSGSEV